MTNGKHKNPSPKKDEKQSLDNLEDQHLQKNNVKLDNSADLSSPTSVQRDIKNLIDNFGEGDVVGNDDYDPISVSTNEDVTHTSSSLSSYCACPKIKGTDKKVAILSDDSSQSCFKPGSQINAKERETRNTICNCMEKGIPINCACHCSGPSLDAIAKQDALAKINEHPCSCHHKYTQICLADSSDSDIPQVICDHVVNPHRCVHIQEQYFRERNNQNAKYDQRNSKIKNLPFNEQHDQENDYCTEPEPCNNRNQLTMSQQLRKKYFQSSYRYHDNHVYHTGLHYQLHRSQSSLPYKRVSSSHQEKTVPGPTDKLKQLWKNVWQYKNGVVRSNNTTGAEFKVSDKQVSSEESGDSMPNLYSAKIKSYPGRGPARLVFSAVDGIPKGKGQVTQVKQANRSFHLCQCKCSGCEKQKFVTPQNWHNHVKTNGQCFQQCQCSGCEKPQWTTPLHPFTHLMQESSQQCKCNCSGCQKQQWNTYLDPSDSAIIMKTTNAQPLSMKTPLLDDFSWKYKEGELVPEYCNLPSAPEAILALRKCACTTGCKTRVCNCKKKNKLAPEIEYSAEYKPSSPTPERIDVYYFDHGNSGYYRTTDIPPPLVSEMLVERADEYATRFWAEIFSIAHVGVTFITSFILQLYRFLLYSIIRPLFVGLLQLTSDYLFKPFLSILFNGIIQPILIFFYNIATTVRDLVEPLATALGYFLQELANVFRAIRLVEITKKNLTGPLEYQKHNI